MHNICVVSVPMHKSMIQFKQVLCTGTNCTALAETWSKVWEDEVGALAPKIFSRPLQNVKVGGR